jgi:hypothetical protein
VVRTVRGSERGGSSVTIGSLMSSGCVRISSDNGGGSGFVVVSVESGRVICSGAGRSLFSMKKRKKLKNGILTFSIILNYLFLPQH